MYDIVFNPQYGADPKNNDNDTILRPLSLYESADKEFLQSGVGDVIKFSSDVTENFLKGVF